MIGKIERRHANPVWDLPQFEPVSKVVRPPFAFDTIQSDCKNMIGSAAEKANKTDTSPHHQLEAPRFDPAQFKMAVDEVQSILPKITKKDPASKASLESQLNETLLFLLYIACMKARRESSEQSSLTAIESAQKRQETNRTLQEQFFQSLDEKISRSKAESTLNWVSWALWGAIAVSGVASVAITFVTGGAALPTVMIVANSALSVGQGSVQITQGVLNYQNNQATGAMVEIEFERYMNTERIRKEIQAMKESVNEISAVWNQLMEAMNNHYHAATNQ